MERPLKLKILQSTFVARKIMLKVSVGQCAYTNQLAKVKQPLAKELAQFMGIKIIRHKYVREEARTIYTIQKVFEGISMKREFSIGSYKIDLYFPEHNIAIECDEHDHQDRDTNYE